MNAFGKKLLPLMVALAGILSASCTSHLKDKVELVSYSVVSTTVTGPRSADAAIRLEVSNKTSSFKVKHIEGTVNLNGLPLAYLTVEPDPVKVKGHVTGIYDLNVHAVLDENVSLLRVMTMLTREDYTGVTVDVNCKVRSHGISKRISLKDQSIAPYFKL
ncbi:MAG: hypothetical protein J6W74_03385 [Bacteroidales bacterium]|nr:hypothetical protein [Bacteroidales bacterium]